MVGFGSLYSGMDDDNFDYDKNYDVNEVFKDFGSPDAGTQKVARTTVGRIQGGVIVETRKRRTVKMPY